MHATLPPFKAGNLREFVKIFKFLHAVRIFSLLHQEGSWYGDIVYGLRDEPNTD
jgi:hypothetical protein